MNYFLKSCKTNPSIDFIIFSDNKSIDYDANNLKLIPLTLNQYNTLASKKFQLPVNVVEPYKLCDFKPMYGKIFEEHLTDYAFWGCCDIDVVFGNIRKFITTEILIKYDIISARKEFLCGHFSLFKNTQHVNELYRKSADYEKVVTEPSYCYSFDECGRIWQVLLKGKSIWDCQAPIDSMTHVIKRSEIDGDITVYFETLVSEPDKHKDDSFEMERYEEELLWNHGTLTALHQKKEFMHFHANILKNWRHFNIPSPEKIPSKFYISERGFVTDRLRRFVKSLKLILQN